MWPAPTFQLGCQKGSNPDVTTSWLCDAGQVKPQSFHLSNGPRKAPLLDRRFMQSVRLLAPAYPWRCLFPAVDTSRPGRVAFPPPPPGLPLGCVPTWSHLTPEAPSMPSPCLWDVLRAPHTLKPLGPLIWSEVLVPARIGQGQRFQLATSTLGTMKLRIPRMTPILSQLLSPVQACRRRWALLVARMVQTLPSSHGAARPISSAMAPAHPRMPRGARTSFHPDSEGVGGPEATEHEWSPSPPPTASARPVSLGPSPGHLPLSHSKRCPILPHVRHSG